MVDTIKLKKLRCQQGYFTASSFARALGVKVGNYQNRESGRVPFSAEEIVKICELLHISLEEGVSFLI